ncbi:hypothetical protein [Mangrovimonas cancribranchiae]|uniref:Uncharacterized protein n=1 Tax=Mangrovimonas cancribranchiae TaxID=3080055 RepID=A0AAU6NYA8_9FLAO
MRTLITKARALSYLEIPKVKHDLPQDTQRRIASKSLALKKTTAVIRKQINIGQGTIPLITSNTQEETGVSTFEGDRLPDRKNIVFNAVALGYGTHATDSDKAAVINYDASLIPSLRNAELEIKSDGKVVATVQCSEFSNDLAAASGRDLYFDLGGEYMIREGKKFEINLKFPEGATGGGTVDYVEVRLDAIATSEN